MGTPPTTLSEKPIIHIRQPMLKKLSTYTRPCEEPLLHAKRLRTYIWQPMLERLSTYIQPCKETILHAKRALHLHLTTNVRNAQHLHSTMRGTNPPCQNGSALTSDHCSNQSYNCLRMALHLHLIIVGTNTTIALEWICTYI